MKKNIRRWLALCLALVLMLSLAVVAAAATTASLSFTNITGAYTITMTKGNRNDKEKAIPGATRYAHAYGELTPILDDRSYDVTYIVSLTSPYEAPLETLLGRIGLEKYCQATGRTGDIYYYAEPDDATGTYTVAVGYKCYDAHWTLVLDEPYSGTADTGRSETIRKVPTDEWYVTTVKVS